MKSCAFTKKSNNGVSNLKNNPLPFQCQDSDYHFNIKRNFF